MAHKRWDFGRRNCGTGRKNYGILQVPSAVVSANGDGGMLAEEVRV